MVWRRLLLTAILAAIPASEAAPAPSTCTLSQINAGSCGAINDPGVDVWTWDSFGSAGADTETVVDDLPPGTYTPGFAQEPEPAPPVDDDCLVLDPNSGCAIDPTLPEPPAVPGEPTVTIRDIASFRPAIPADAMEPDGWGVIGLPVNLVSGASAQTLAGTLLGRPAEVRFTPVGYAWTANNGAHVASASPGATWAQLGQREFTTTATSLVFTERGTYDVQPTITYTAQYRFDGSVWRTIAGTLDLPGPTRSVLIGEVDTVLVTADCTARPDGPGC